MSSQSTTTFITRHSLYTTTLILNTMNVVLQNLIDSDHELKAAIDEYVEAKVEEEVIEKDEEIRTLEAKQDTVKGNDKVVPVVAPPRQDEQNKAQRIAKIIKDLEDCDDRAVVWDRVDGNDIVEVADEMRRRRAAENEELERDYEELQTFINNFSSSTDKLADAIKENKERALADLALVKSMYGSSTPSEDLIESAQGRQKRARR